MTEIGSDQQSRAESAATPVFGESVTRAVASVDVCVCTFRRPSVAETLKSIASQNLPPGVHVRVIVADNDTDPSARDVVNAAFASSRIDGVYLHAPAQNISIARNACLDAATAPLAVFIDDDEIARPGWLAALLRHQAESGADVVFGPVDAVYAQDAPAWMRVGDMHSTRPIFRGEAIEGGYTCNVLLAAPAVGDRRFDPAMGRSGGEDTAFFTELTLAGAKLSYCPGAGIDEPVPAGRSSLKWLMRRSFRNGQTHGLMQIRQGKVRAIVAAGATLKAGACAGLALASLWSPSKWRRSAVRGALHAGVIATALGKPTLQLYG